MPLQGVGWLLRVPASLMPAAITASGGAKFPQVKFPEHTCGGAQAAAPALLSLPGEVSARSLSLPCPFPPKG